MISVVVLVSNNQEIIFNHLNALQEFDEIVVVDTGSSDNTIPIAKQFPNVKVFQKPFDSFGKLRNFGASQAKNDWILALDTDEIVSSELNDYLKKLSLNPQNIYSISFKNYFKGTWIKSCGWYPESHVRLYNRKKTKFSNDLVHEKVLENNLDIQKVSAPVFHYSYRNVDDFLIKMKRYSCLFAEQYTGKKKSSVFKAVYHGFFAFCKSYFLRKGFLDKGHGFIISVYQANTAFYKYLKLKEMNENASDSSVSSSK